MIHQHEPTEAAIELEDEFRCCCGCCHVEQGAVTIGVLRAVGAAVSLVLSLLGGSPLFAAISGISLVICLCVPLAQWTRKASLHIPFLLLNVR